MTITFLDRATPKPEHPCGTGGNGGGGARREGNRLILRALPVPSAWLDLRRIVRAMRDRADEQARERLNTALARDRAGRCGAGAERQ